MAYVGTPIDTTNQFQSLQGKRFSGDASTTAFTLDIAPNSVFDIEVFVENVRQDPNSAYSINGTTLTFGAAPPSGTNNIYVIHQAKAVGTISPTSDSVVASSIADEAIESEHLNNNIISGQTALAANPATDDELLISDAGTIKRIDAQFFQNTPAFHVTRSSTQSIGNSSNTKIQWNNEILDTDNAFDSSTNYRFTPQVAGNYFIAMHVRLNSSTDAEQCFINIKKNTTDILQSYYKNTYYNGHYGAVFVNLNGSSDYIEFYIHHNIGSSVDLDANDQNCYAYGFKVTGAA